MFGTKTVKNVYDQFTAGLKKVATEQQAVSDKSSYKQDELWKKIEAERVIKATAESEIAQADSAMKGIGELLGIEE